MPRKGEMKELTRSAAQGPKLLREIADRMEAGSDAEFILIWRNDSAALKPGGDLKSRVLTNGVPHVLGLMLTPLMRKLQADMEHGRN